VPPEARRRLICAGKSAAKGGFLKPCKERAAGACRDAFIAGGRGKIIHCHCRAQVVIDVASLIRFIVLRMIRPKIAVAYFFLPSFPSFLPRRALPCERLFVRDSASTVPYICLRAPKGAARDAVAIFFGFSHRQATRYRQRRRFFSFSCCIALPPLRSDAPHIFAFIMMRGASALQARRTTSNQTVNKQR